MKAFQSKKEQINCDQQRKIHASNEMSSDIDLPTEFTNKIINVIQSKHSDDEGEVLSAQFFAPSPPENNQYNRRKPDESNEGEQADVYRQDYMDIANNEEYVQYKMEYPPLIKKKLQSLHEQEQSSPFEGKNNNFNHQQRLNHTKKRGRPRIHPYPSPKTADHIAKRSVKRIDNKLEAFQRIKKHLEDYLTTILKTMQDVTNQKLDSIINRIQSLQKKMGTTPKMLKYAERQINDDGASVNGASSSRNHYTKMETKIQCIDSIERGQATVEQVASRLHLPVQVIRNWFSNKQRLRQSYYKKQSLIHKEYAAQ